MSATEALVPGRGAVRPRPTERALALVASPATRETATPLRALPSPTSSREGNGDPGPGRSEVLTTAQTDKLIGEVLARHTQTFEALDAFEDLNHGLMLARERGDEVPCVGPGAEAWTSDEAVDQEAAEDLCLLCPMAVFALCQRYADTAQPEAGTWAGVTRDKARTVSSEWAVRKARGVPVRRKSGSRDCTCRCGGTTGGGFYLPGHDSRHLAALVTEVRDGRLTREAALSEVAHSEKLQVKLTARLGR